MKPRTLQAGLSVRLLLQRRQSPRLALDAHDSRDTRASRARSGHEGCPACPAQAPAGAGWQEGPSGGDKPDERRPPLDGDLTQSQPQGQAGAGGKGLFPQGPCPHQSSKPFSLAADSQFLKVACATCLPGRKPSEWRPAPSAQPDLRLARAPSTPGASSQRWGGRSCSCFHPASPCVDSPISLSLTAGRREAASAQPPGKPRLSAQLALWPKAAPPSGAPCPSGERASDSRVSEGAS